MQKSMHPLLHQFFHKRPQSPQFDFAIFIAEHVHAQQLDLIGNPYISHPFRVMNAFTDRDLRIVALLHDVLEDCEEQGFDLGPMKQLFEQVFSPEVNAAILAITRKPKEDYVLDYLPRVARNALACRVKIADATDNLKRLSQAKIFLTSDRYSTLQLRYQVVLKMLQPTSPDITKAVQ